MLKSKVHAYSEQIERLRKKTFKEEMITVGSLVVIATTLIILSDFAFGHDVGEIIQRSPTIQMVGQALIVTMFVLLTLLLVEIRRQKDRRKMEAMIGYMTNAHRRLQEVDPANEELESSPDCERDDLSDKHG